MKSIVIGAIAAAGIAAAGVAGASEELAKNGGCLTCHAVGEKKVAASFKDIGAKYKGKAGAEADLVAKLTGAKGHPKVKASDEEVKKLVGWILRL
jgi:cytochrome c